MRLILPLLLASCLEEGASPADADRVDPLAQDLASPPGVQFTQTPLIPGQPATFTVTGVGPGDRVYFARSTAGLGAGPCFPLLGGVCLGITSPSQIGFDIADSQGTAELTLTLPTPIPPVFVYTQAIVDSFAGYLATNTITAPILLGGLDDDGDGFCEGTQCHDPSVLPGDCNDANDEVFPGQALYFAVPYPTPTGPSYDYDCDGVEVPISTRTYRCQSGTTLLLCASHRDGWTSTVPDCGDQAYWGAGCISFPVPIPLPLSCVPDTETAAYQHCR